MAIVQLLEANPQSVFDLLAPRRAYLNQDGCTIFGYQAPHQTCKDWRASEATVVILETGYTA